MLQKSVYLIGLSLGVATAWIGQPSQLFNAQWPAEKKEWILESGHKIQVNAQFQNDTLQKLQLQSQEPLTKSDISEIQDRLYAEADWQEIRKDLPIDEAFQVGVAKKPNSHRWFIHKDKNYGILVEMNTGLRSSNWTIESVVLKSPTPESIDVTYKVNELKNFKQTSSCSRPQKQCVLQHQSIPELSALVRKSTFELKYFLNDGVEILPQDLNQLTEDPRQRREFAQILRNYFQLESRIVIRAMLNQTESFRIQPWDWYRVSDEHLISVEEIEKRLQKNEAQDWPFFVWKSAGQVITFWTDLKGHYRAEVKK